MAIPRIKPALPSFANDNLSMWQQGSADSRMNRWSEELANRAGPAGLDYLSGWVASNDVR